MLLWMFLYRFSYEPMLFYSLIPGNETVGSFCDPMDCSPPGFSVPGISQARILEKVAISFSRGSSQPRDLTQVSCISRWILYHWATKQHHNGDSMLNFLRNHQTVFQGSCTILHFHWQCLRILKSLHILANLSSPHPFTHPSEWVWSCISLVLICFSLMTNDGEGNGTALRYSCLENPMGGGARYVEHLCIYFWPFVCLLWRNVYSTFVH